jgi:hypothetical protein
MMVSHFIKDNFVIQAGNPTLKISKTYDPGEIQNCHILNLNLERIFFINEGIRRSQRIRYI